MIKEIAVSENVGCESVGLIKTCSWSQLLSVEGFILKLHPNVVYRMFSPPSSCLICLFNMFC